MFRVEFWQYWQARSCGRNHTCAGGGPPMCTCACCDAHFNDRTVGVCISGVHSKPACTRTCALFRCCWHCVNVFSFGRLSNRSSTPPLLIQSPPRPARACILQQRIHSHTHTHTQAPSRRHKHARTARLAFLRNPCTFVC